MRDVLTLLRRELHGYFNSPIAYIFLVVFLLLNCGLYMTTFFLEGRVEMRTFFGILPFVLMVFLPAATMRLWAEERVLGTDELLLTFPVPTWKIVLGKYSASLLFLLLALAGTLPVPVMLSVLGDPDGGAIAAGYVGAFLLGAFFLALGLFLSGLSRDQIVAFVVSMAVAFTLFLMGTDYVASILDGWIGGFGSFLRRAVGLAHRYDSFTRGVVDLRAVFFFVVGCVLFLTLNVLSVERRYRPRAQTRFAGAALPFLLLLKGVLL